MRAVGKVHQKRLRLVDGKSDGMLSVVQSYKVMSTAFHDRLQLSLISVSKFQEAYGSLDRTG